MMKMFYEDGEYRPYFVCEMCKKKITKNNPGVYIHELSTAKKNMDVSIACEGSCHNYVEKMKNNNVSGWHHIKMLLVYITNNTLNQYDGGRKKNGR